MKNMTKNQKYRINKGPHSRIEDGKRVSYGEGDVITPTDRELETISDRLEPVVDKSDDGDSNPDGKSDDNSDGNENNSNDDSNDYTSLEKKKVDELMDIAREIDIDGRSKLRNDKTKLVKAVKKELAKQEAGD